MRKQLVGLHSNVCQVHRRPRLNWNHSPPVGSAPPPLALEMKRAHPEMLAPSAPLRSPRRSGHLLPFFYCNKLKHYEPGGSRTRINGPKSLTGTAMADSGQEQGTRGAYWQKIGQGFAPPQLHQKQEVTVAHRSCFVVLLLFVFLLGEGSAHTRAALTASPRAT